MPTQRLLREHGRDWQCPLDDEQGALAADLETIRGSLFDLDVASAGGELIPRDLPPPEIAEQMRLVDFPRNEMIVVCTICDKRVRLRTHRLIAEHGRKEKIVDVIASLSTACNGSVQSGCELALVTAPA